MLADEDRAWLVDLNGELWPEPETTERKKGVLFQHANNVARRVIVLDANRKLLHEEVYRICTLIEKTPLLTSMSSKGMFGGFAMIVYEHPDYPHVPPTRLLMIIEDHLPPPKGPSVYEHIAGTARPPDPEPKKRPGCGTDQAWELFSKYTHSDRNSAWLKEYNMNAPQERYHYDY